MELSLFDYDLPESFIAQTPIEPRDHSKLMLVDRYSGEVQHTHFYDIVSHLNAGDVLVLNDTRVIHARLSATKMDTQGKVEVLLLRQVSSTDWWVIVGGRNVTLGKTLQLENTAVTLEVLEEGEEAQRLVRFSEPIEALLPSLGQVPLPPYIHERLSDEERYQTVYSRHEGSAAAPTAGLHFTPDLLLKLRERGVQFAYCTLHIGLDTFQPMKANNIKDHKIHSEWASLNATNAKLINDAKLGGKRIIAVGTTSARTLETAAILSSGGDTANPDAEGAICAWRPVIAFEAHTNLYITPNYRWRVCDGIITNFHLPKSSLLVMISSFMGRENLLSAYEIAKEMGYRFFSFGDAMFIR
jgi:S-adenosylmethionine:tRNA ribosyltransferase-isomerase